MSIKKLKYFIASAGSLSEERESIETYLNRKNDQLIDENIYLEVVIWEKLSSSFNKERIQNAFNNEILNCDIMLCLVFDRVGPFTYEEFYNAIKSFKQGGNPKRIYLYFKNAPINSCEITEEFQSVLKLRNEIKTMEQISIDYSNIAELLLDIEKNFKLDYKVLTQLSTKEQIVELLQKVNPVIIKSFQDGKNDVHVFLTQENLSLLNKLVMDSKDLRLIELIDRNSAIFGFATLLPGTYADLTQGSSSFCRLFTIRKLENFKN